MKEAKLLVAFLIGACLLPELGRPCDNVPLPSSGRCELCETQPSGVPNHQSSSGGSGGIGGGYTDGGPSARIGTGWTCPSCLHTWGVPELTLIYGAVKVDDTPIWFDEPQGPSFSFGMHYSSLDDRSRTNQAWAIGYRWQHDYACYIVSSGSNRFLYLTGGAYFKFTQNGQGSYVETTGYRIQGYGGKYQLFANGSNLLVYIRGGGKYEFEPDGSGSRYRLISITDPRGDLLSINYTTNNLVDFIVTAATDTFNFAYSPSGFLTNIHDVTGNRNCVLIYSNDFLAQVTDMGGQTFKYEYNSNGLLTALYRPNMTNFDKTVIAYTGTITGGAYSATITYPEGNQEKFNWGGYSYSTMDTDLGLGGVTRETSDFNYSWGDPVVEREDALGRVTSFIYYDTTNAILTCKIKKQVNPDDTITENQYNDFGDLTFAAQEDANGNILNTTTITYGYFSGTREPETVQTEVRDASSNLVAKSFVRQARDNRGSSNVWDSVYTRISEKTWFGTNATDYMERKYTYTTNFLRATEQALVGPGINDYRLVWTNTFDSQNRVVAQSDAATNTVYLNYNSVNLVASQTRFLPRGNPGTNDDISVTTSWLYDNLNRQTNVVYPDGFTESWKHAPCGCGVLSHVDRGGNVTSNSYNANKWLSKVRTWSTNGTLLKYVENKYNSAQEITNVIDVLSNRTVSIYNTAGELWKSIDALSRVTEYKYDNAGRQYLTIYPDTSSVSNSFDVAGRLTKTTRYGNSSVLTYVDYIYDAAGRQVATRDFYGTVISNEFDLAGRAIRNWNFSRNIYNETTYDKSGNLVLQIGPVEFNATQAEKDAATVSNSYDIVNRLVATVDAEKSTNSWMYSLDYPSQVSQALDANNQVVQENFYDLNTGHLLTNVNHGVKTVYEYSPLGQVVKTTYPDSSCSSSLYDGSRFIATVSRTGNTNWFGFDAAGRRILITNSLGKVTQFALDSVGNTTNMMDALTNKTTYVFDSMNKLTKTIRPDGSTSTNTYSQLGNLIARTGAGSVPAFYGYDMLSRMTNLADGVGNSTKFLYDCCANLTEKEYADGSFYSYAYVPRNWLDIRVDPKSNMTVYGYNNAGQLTNVNYATDTDVRYFYDNLGRMTNCGDAAGTWTWIYDGASHRMTSETLRSPTGEAWAVNYTYVSNTYELASVSLGSNYVVQYSWSAGRLTNVSWQVNGQIGSVAYSYLPNSDLLNLTTYQPNNSTTLSVSRAYDALSHLTNVNAVASGSTINSFSYTLDSVGRRTARQDVDGSHTLWGYDNFDQLTSATRTNSPNGAHDAAYNFGYQYDLVGNRLHEDRGLLHLDGGFNNLNQLTHISWAGKLDVVGSVGVTGAVVKVNGENVVLFNGTNYWGAGKADLPGSNNIPIVAWLGTNRTEMNRTVYMPPTKPQVFLWDQNGNLTNDGQKTYFWNEENKVKAIESLVGEKKRSEFIFDAQSRMTERKDLTGWTGSGYVTTNITRYVRDGYRILAEIQYIGSQVITNNFVWGLDLSQSLEGAGGVGGLLAQIPGTNTLAMTYDGNGNVADVLNLSSLDIPPPVVGHFEYDPFGRLTVANISSGLHLPFRFSTKVHDDIWGLEWYEFRPYSPNLHIWLNRDPTAGDEGTLQEFNMNNPICNEDALGLLTFRSVGYAGADPKLRIEVENREESGESDSILAWYQQKLHAITNWFGYPQNGLCNTSETGPQPSHVQGWVKDDCCPHQVTCTFSYSAEIWHGPVAMGTKADSPPGGVLNGELLGKKIHKWLPAPTQAANGVWTSKIFAYDSVSVTITICGEIELYHLHPGINVGTKQGSSNIGAGFSESMNASCVVR